MNSLCVYLEKDEDIVWAEIHTNILAICFIEMALPDKFEQYNLATGISPTSNCYIFLSAVRHIFPIHDDEAAMTESIISRIPLNF